jgi:amino acid adenylation domain-containing protein/non-ribosomal peptide synthase protein (TIGR01720 family)
MPCDSASSCRSRRLATSRACFYADNVMPLTHAPRSERIDARLSPQQQRLLTLLRDAPEAYHARCALTLEGPIDVGALEQALARIVTRHDVLRSEIIDVGGARAPVQRASKAPQAGGIRQTMRADGRAPLVRPLTLDVDEVGPSRHRVRLELSPLWADRFTLRWLARTLLDEYASPLGRDHRDRATTRFSAIAEWLHDVASSRESHAGVEFWSAQRRLAVGAADAPFARAFVDAPFAADTVRADIDEASVARIEAHAARHKRSLAVWLFAAWAAVLIRFREGRTSFVAWPCDGRLESDLGEVPGPLTRFVPIVVTDDIRQSFETWAHRCDVAIDEAQAWQECYTWDDAPLDGRGASAVGFEYDDWRPIGAEASRAPATRPAVVEYRADVCIEPMTFRVTAARTMTGLEVTCHYDRARCTAAEARWLLGALCASLRAVAAEPTMTIDALPLLDDPGRRRLAIEIDSGAHPRGSDIGEPRSTARDITDAAEARDATAATIALHEHVARQARRTPEAVAVAFADRTLTYRALDALGNRIAHALLARGVTPDSLVPVCLERSLALPAALLGVLKAGAAYVPLDPGAPRAVLEFVVRDCRASVVVTDERSGQGLLDDVARLLLDRGDIDDARDTDPGVRVTPDHLAYAIYTSGSTGQPKGVMIPHRAIGNHMAWMCARFPLTGDRVLQKTPVTFDASVWEFWAPLMQGARLVMAGPSDHRDPDALLATIERERITVLQLVPSLLRMCLETGAWSRARSLRLLFCGGEALPAALADAALEQLDGDARGHEPGHPLEVYNLYGPTEAAIDSTCGRHVRGGSSATTPIGRPIRRTSCHVIDRRFEPLPPGIRGELHIGGPALARGYLRRPDLTAERFVPDPLSGEPGARLYRTGDRVRWDGDGLLEYLGRDDQQVKIRGHRVELGHVEHVLELHEDVRHAAVLLRESNGRHQLTAWIAPRTGRDPSSATLRTWLGARLPDYMVPALIGILDRLPITPNGKLDRRALLALEPTTTRAAADRGPRTPTEQALVDVWREGLGRAQVGVEDNFFELGGDSILSIQIVARARQRGVHFTPRDLFRHQTIAALAAAADCAAGTWSDAGLRPENAHDVAAPTTPSSESSSASLPVPLTPAQRSFFAALHPERHHFNQSLVLAAREPAVLPALAAAVTAVVAHHAALRMRFAEAADGWHAWLPSQALSPASSPPSSPASSTGSAASSTLFTCVDLRDVSAAAHARVWMSIASQAQRSLDLTNGPLLRIVVVPTSAGERVLLIAHHLVMDGVSWRVLLDDLARAYAQARLGTAIALGRPSTAWSTWATALAAYAAGSALAAERAYWTAVVGGIAPARRSAAPNAVQSSARRANVTLSVTETRALVSGVAREWRASTEAALLAAVGAALSAIAPPSSHTMSHTAAEWLIDLEGHGRESAAVDARLDLSRTVGWFTTIYPVRVPAPAGRQWDAVVRDVHARLAAIPQKGLGYGLLGGGQHATVSLNYQGQWDRVLTSGGPFVPANDPAGPYVSPSSPLLYPLDLGAQVRDERLAVQILHDPHVHDTAAIDVFATTLRTALQQIAAAVDDLHQILAELNG